MADIVLFFCIETIIAERSGATERQHQRPDSTVSLAYYSAIATEFLRLKRRLFTSARYLLRKP